MPERLVWVNGKLIRAGTAEVAGALWRSSRNPTGVSGTRYRWYANESKRRGWRGAPGPIQVPADPDQPDGPTVTLFDPEFPTRPLYDLAAVEVANAERPPRTGMFRDRKSADTLSKTALRTRLLLVAGRGELLVSPETGRTIVEGEVVSSRVAQSRDELQSLGLLGDADEAGVVPLTEAGRVVLRRWGVTPPEPPTL